MWIELSCYGQITKILKSLSLDQELFCSLILLEKIANSTQLRYINSMFAWTCTRIGELIKVADAMRGLHTLMLIYFAHINNSYRSRPNVLPIQYSLEYDRLEPPYLCHRVATEPTLSIIWSFYYFFYSRAADNIIGNHWHWYIICVRMCYLVYSTNWKWFAKLL